MNNRKAFLLSIPVILVACTAKLLKYDESKQLERNSEFEQAVQIVEVPPVVVADSISGAKGEVVVHETVPIPTTTTLPKLEYADKKSNKKSDKTAKKKKEVIPLVESPPAPPRRQPEIESDIGFQGRRPMVDPFRVGERVVHSVNYFKMKAGNLVLETRPYAMVNGLKNYQFRTSIKTSSFFSSFYTVDDYVDVLMDFDQLIPSVFALHVKESAQLKEAQMFFDQAKGVATYWEKKVTEKNGEENKKLQWDIFPYAQNVFSAAFYMRVFHWEVGKENAFHVADDEKNLIFRGKAIRKERISTDVGEFDAIVIRPEMELKGKFNPVGDNYIWLSDDDRKFILRIESKIQIGTLVSEIVELQKGLE